MRPYLRGGDIMYKHIESSKHTYHFGLFNRRNVYCHMSAVIQRLHSSPTLTNKLVMKYKRIEDLPKEEPTYSMIKPVYAYATYDPKLNNESQVYSIVRDSYEHIDNHIADKNGRNGYVPNHLMVAAFLPLIYSLFPDDFQLILQELNMNIIDFTNNIVEAKSLILDDNYCFFKQEYRQKVYELYEKMYSSFPSELKSSDFCCAVCEVFPNKELTGGHAVTLIKSSTGEYFIIDDQSRINLLGDYISQHKGHIYEISIKDIDGTSIANVNSIIRATCTDDPTGTFNARVTRYVLHIGNEDPNMQSRGITGGRLNKRTSLTGGDDVVDDPPADVPAPKPTPVETPAPEPTPVETPVETPTETISEQYTDTTTNSNTIGEIDKKWIFIGVGIAVVVIIIIVVVVIVMKKKKSSGEDNVTEPNPEPEKKGAAKEGGEEEDVAEGEGGEEEDVVEGEGVTLTVGKSGMAASDGKPQVATAGDKVNDKASTSTKEGEKGLSGSSDKSSETTSTATETSTKTVSVTVSGDDEEYLKHAKALIDKIRPKFTDMSACLDELEKSGIDKKISVTDAGVFSGMIDDGGQPYTKTLKEICENRPKEFSMVKTNPDGSAPTGAAANVDPTNMAQEGTSSPMNEPAKESYRRKRHRSKKLLKLDQ